MSSSIELNSLTTSQKFKAARAACGLSNKALALALNVPAARLKSLTVGRAAKFTPDEIRILVTELGISANYLLMGEGPVLAFTPTKAFAAADTTHERLLLAFGKLNKASREAAIAVVEALHKTSTPKQDNFIRILLRLKLALNVTEDRAVAALLGMSRAAFFERKKHGSFPADKLKALAHDQPALGLDVNYILTASLASADAENRA